MGKCSCRQQGEVVDVRHGELIGDEETDPHASSRQMIEELEAKGDSATAARLKAGLDAVLAAEDQP